jgi:hypothetical protein
MSTPDTVVRTVRAKILINCLRCKRLAFAQDDKIIQTPEHSHPSDRYRLEAKLCEHPAVKKAGENLTSKQSEIINEPLTKLTITARFFLKSPKSILRRI